MLVKGATGNYIANCMDNIWTRFTTAVTDLHATVVTKLKLIRLNVEITRLILYLFAIPINVTEFNLAMNVTSLFLYIVYVVFIMLPIILWFWYVWYISSSLQTLNRMLNQRCSWLWQRRTQLMHIRPFLQWATIYSSFGKVWYARTGG